MTPVIVAEDLDHMRAIGSPLAGVLGLLAKGSAVLSSDHAAREHYLDEIQAALGLAVNPITLFDGLGEDQVGRCLEKSTLIECRRGDRLIKQGNVAQNMYVVMSETLEVRDAERLVAIADDVVGEMAFLLKSPRSMGVHAATDDVRVLSLSESNLKRMIEGAAKLLLNLAKMLSYKLLRQG